MKAAMLYRYGWLLLSCLTGLANAASITITAEYNPANYVEDRAIFINTTPCAQAPVNWCSSGTASIDKPHAVMISTNTYRQVKNTDDKRWGIHYLTFPAARDVSVFNSSTGRSYTFKFILTHIGTQTLREDTNMFQEQGDCINDRHAESNSASFHFSKIKESKQLSGGLCYSDKNHFSKTVRITNLYLAYKLQSPSPLLMENGVYRGKLVFLMGENKDFDLGGGTYGDTYLEVNLVITVKHQIKVEMPANASKVELKPPHGWTEWMQTGRTPPYLEGDISYKIWATSDYAVFVRCGSLSGTNCLLKNAQTGYTSRLTVYNMNALGEETMLSPVSANRFPVNKDGVGIFGRDQKIIFRIDKANLSQVLKYPGGVYTGTVVIVFDALL